MVEADMALNEIGMTAMHVLCSIFNERLQWMLHTLLKHKADPNKQDVHGRTPIHFAASSGNVVALTYLIRNCKDLNLNLQSTGGETALFKAI